MASIQGYGIIFHNVNAIADLFIHDLIWDKLHMPPLWYTLNNKELSCIFVLVNKNV